MVNSRRAEYSRLRQIIRKRYLRATDAGFGGLPIYDIVKIFQPLKQIADEDIEPLIQEAQRFILETPNLKSVREMLAYKQQEYLQQGLFVDDIVEFEQFVRDSDDNIRNKLRYNKYLQGEYQIKVNTEIMEAYQRWRYSQA